MRDAGVRCGGTCARSGSRTSARRRFSGSAPRAGRSRGRSSGRTGGRPERCRELPADLIRSRTGLVPDPYFSATKLEWLLARTEARPGELAFGTVDSWLVWKLTDGRVHATDLTNASRTMLLDLDSLDWDDELLELFGVDRCGCCPARRLVRGGRRGEAARRDAADRGDRRRPAGGALRPRLLTSAARRRRRTGRGASCSSTSATRARAGAAGPAGDGGGVRRLRARGRDPRRAAPRSSGCATASGSSTTQRRARRWRGEVESTGGVYFVPALTGLGSPHWDADARGLDHRHHARDDRRPPRPCRARGDRLPGRRRARRVPGRRAACCAPTAARAPTRS